MSCYEGPVPTWIHAIGIRDAEDIGNGMGFKVGWQQAAPGDQDDDIFYNIYYAKTRYGVFDEGPKAITNAHHAVVNIEPGILYYFLVKATEIKASTFGTLDLVQIGNHLYQYPTAQTLLDAVDAYGVTIQVTDSTGYPPVGYLRVGEEVVQYTSVGTNEFYVTETQRGQYGTDPQDHSIGETVSLFEGIEDTNSNVLQGMADWLYYNPITQEVRSPPQNTSAIGQIDVDEDGYRIPPIDINGNEDHLTTDLTVSDAQTEDFPNYDYTGYHRPSIQSTLSGYCVNSYLGGEFDGYRGFAYQDRIMSQLDALLQVTGEPMILLRRKWTGVRCRCVTLNREHPRERCPYCYGTGFEGGYNQFLNPRPVSELLTTPPDAYSVGNAVCNLAGVIMVRVTPYTNDLELVQDQGLRQPDEITGWTLPVPTVKDRDVLIRFTLGGIEEFRYEILNVTRNKLFFNQSGRQEFKMRKLDKTDIIYQFATVI